MPIYLVKWCNPVPLLSLVRARNERGVELILDRIADPGAAQILGVYNGPLFISMDLTGGFKCHEEWKLKNVNCPKCNGPLQIRRNGLGIRTTKKFDEESHPYCPSCKVRWMAIDASESESEVERIVVDAVGDHDELDFFASSADDMEDAILKRAFPHLFREIQGRKPNYEEPTKAKRKKALQKDFDDTTAAIRQGQDDSYEGGGFPPTEL